MGVEYVLYNLRREDPYGTSCLSTVERSFFTRGRTKNTN